MRPVPLNAMALVLSIALLAVACSSSTKKTPPATASMTDELELTTPPLPVPTYAGDSLPPYSGEIVTDLVPVRLFTPRITSVPANYVSGLATAIQVAVQTDGHFECVPFSASLRLGGIILQSGGARVSPQTLIYWEALCGGMWGISGAWTSDIRPLPFASKEALLRRTVRWAKLDEASMNRGGTYTNTVTVTNGTSVTDATELSFTVGLGGTFDFLSLSAELTTTFTHSVTVETEVSKSEALACTPDAAMPGNTFHCSFWQLEEIFEIVDREGAPWTDPFYATAATPALVSRTKHRWIAIVGF